MSPVQNDDSSSSFRSTMRPRSNTNSILNWGRPKFHHSVTGDSSSQSSTNTTAPPASPAIGTSPSADALIDLLSPPNVPSISYAKSLAATLSTCSPLPHHQKLTPVLLKFCGRGCPSQFQAVGFDILSAYWESSEAAHETLGTADRVTYFAFFEDNSFPWSLDLCEARIKALRALTRGGQDVDGLEYEFIRVVTSWIDEAFSGWLDSSRSENDNPFGSTIDRTEVNERERCIDLLAGLLSTALQDNLRLRDLTQGRLLDFYVGLVNRSIDVAPPPTAYPVPTPHAERPSAYNSPTTSKAPHRRNVSSMSATSLPSPSSSSATSFFHQFSPTAIPEAKMKPPQEKAIQLYLDALQPQLKTLFPAALNEIMPVLFRSMAYSAYPLQRLGLHDRSRQYQVSSEARIMDVVHSLLGGPYSPAVMRLIKRAMYAPIPPESPSIETGPNESFKHGDRSPSLVLLSSIQKSHGAFRVLRSLIRRTLSTRMARAYISREVNMSYSHSGAPTRLDLGSQEVEQELLERAWSSSSNNPGGLVGWDAATVGKSMRESVKSWVQFDARRHTQPIVVVANGGDSGGVLGMRERIDQAREKLLEEAASLVRDILHELDERDEARPELGGVNDGRSSSSSKATLDPDEAVAVGGTLNELAQWVRALNTPSSPTQQQQMPFIFSLGQPSSSVTPLVYIITTLLERDHATSLFPPLSTILWNISDYLRDEDAAKIPAAMMQQRELEPVTVGWLDNWRKLLLRAPEGDPSVTSFLCPSKKPMTVKAILSSVQVVYENIKDVPEYRRPLAGILWDYCRVTHEASMSECIRSGPVDAISSTLWNLLGDEVVLRQQESIEDGDDVALVQAADQEISKALDLLFAVAVEADPDDQPEDIDTDAESSFSHHSHSVPPVSASISAFGQVIASPVFARRQTDATLSSGVSSKDKEPKESGLMSLLSSLTSVKPASPASQHPPPPVAEALPSSQNASPAPSEPPSDVLPRPVGAVSALVRIFSALAFSPSSLEPRSIQLILRIFDMLCRIASPHNASPYDDTIGVVAETVVSARARLAALQFLMRLRADREHHMYFIDHGQDVDGHIAGLAALIHRAHRLRSSSDADIDSPVSGPSPESSRVRTKIMPERLGRRTSRGRGAQPSPSATSRSRSRLGRGVPPPPLMPQRPRIPLWGLPEALPFSTSEADMPSEGLTTYDLKRPENEVLPISDYLELVLTILEHETDWEILSYVLCHLPSQLANKHLFCGPICREKISLILNFLCPALFHGELASKVDRWPPGLKPRDAQGLGYHTLSVLISYKRHFDTSQRKLLVEVFQLGLNGQPATIKCCLHALCLAAFELQTAVTKCMSSILERLSEIMSNAEMAVHILGFLAITGSLRPLQANFTEADYKKVFGVALRYLQLHDHDQLNSSFALAQHVRILSYYNVYLWFLAIKVPDRPRQVSYITRQLLLANAGKQPVDDATEVCFDWLARYAYGSADPRPANSTLSDVIMDPASHAHAEPPVEKAWMVGNAVLTVRTLPRLGWVEIISRRPSGLTKFLTHVENVPLVGAGDVQPDLFSVPAVTMMNRSDPQATNPVPEEPHPAEAKPVDRDSVETSTSPAHSESDDLPVPDPITGYVWSGTAPSQRRKEVSIDPSFFALQIAPYPETESSRLIHRVAMDAPALQKFFTNLDRIPVIDVHKVGILYVAPGQTTETEILANTHGSPFYTRFLEGIGRLINLRGQVDVYAGGLDPDEDGEYAYAWWDDVGQILYHTATLMPSVPHDPNGNFKKRHIGNDFVRIVWNDSGMPYKFDTLATHFQFVNIVIEPHSLGAMAAYSNSSHENEYFKVTVQRAEGMAEFAPVGKFKIISAENLPTLIRQLSLLADWFASVFSHTNHDTVQQEYKTNWINRLNAIRRFTKSIPAMPNGLDHGADDISGQEAVRDFTQAF